jgi:hypothetical protein
MNNDINTSAENYSYFNKNLGHDDLVKSKKERHVKIFENHWFEDTQNYKQ